MAIRSETAGSKEIAGQLEVWADFEGGRSANVLATGAGEILACNEAFLACLGFPSVEDLGERNLFSILGLDTAALEGRLRREGTVLGLDASARRFDGSELELSTSWQIQSGIPGGRTFLRASLAEPASRWNRQEGLRWQLDRKLVSALGHELNNAMAPILLFLTALHKELPRREDRTLLESMEAAVRAGTERVKQLLWFVRSGKGEQLEMDLRPLVRGTIRSLGEVKHAAEIEEDLPEDLCEVVGNPGEISLALYLLLSATLRETRGGGRVRVRAVEVDLGSDRPGRGRYVMIEFASAPDGQRQGADSDSNGETAASPVSVRHGLDLAVVKTIVEAQHGFLAVIRDDRSTRRSVKAYFRAAPPRPPAPSLPSEPAGEGARELPRAVLVVDDEPTILQVAKRVLELHGIRVLTADTGPAALELLERHGHEIDVVLTDLSMPAMGGARLIQEIRRRRADLPVLAMTGSIEEAEALRRSGTEVQGLVEKPFDATRLLSAMRGELPTT